MKKTLSMSLLSLLLISILTWGVNTGVLEASGYSARDAGRPGNEVLLPLYAVAKVDDIIGGKRVEYWEHIYDGIIQIKNDYILIHRDVVTNEIVKYIKTWRDIDLPDVDIKPLIPPGGDYFWKRVVAFLNNTDLGHFYTLYDTPEFPLICWEVRYTDGTTVMYALYGNRIGYGIPAPSTRAFSLSGPHHGQDVWWNFRLNAHHYFRQWVGSATTIFNPSTATIRAEVSNPATRLYYAIAHGNHERFSGSKKDGTHFPMYNATMAESDMGNRGPMLFAFLGHCEAMRHTGPRTFSHAFRTGQMVGTVTVGYIGMANHPGWNSALPWQDHKFQKMNEGRTVGELDLATQMFPRIATAVKLVGDRNVRVFLPPVSKGSVSKKAVNLSETEMQE